MYLTQSLHRALQQSPNLPMTIHEGRVRAVRETADRVARLAGALRGLGVEPGDRVALLASNSDRYHEAFLATWWCGGVINPLNIRWSAAEIAHALRDAEPKVLLVDGPHAETVRRSVASESRPGVVVYCGEGAAPDGMPGYEELISGSDPVEDLRVGGDALASLLYTGGTTGVPKGVMTSHHSMMVSALGNQVFQRTVLAGGVSLIAAPMFHIAALIGWTQQNLLGGSFVFLPSFEPSAVLEAVERHRVTSTTLVPTMLQMLLDHPELDRFDLCSMEAVGYGAAPMPAPLLARAMKAFPRSGFVQGYGMTETAIVTALTREDHLAGGPRLRSAGRAAPHCQVRIAGPDGRELPRGEVGELLARGDALMQGYWKLPDQTAQALAGGWMHTGDAARMDEEGYVFIVDRLKDMIITGGENVYSSEVENALATHPAVAACAVVGLPDDRWGERVHAAVVLRAGAAATADDLRAHAAGLIAGCKVPRSVAFVEGLPVSAAGKVLKRELRGFGDENPASLRYC